MRNYIAAVGYVESIDYIKTMMDQIGHKTFFMIGATKFTAIDTYTLRFNIMKNKSGANHVELHYNLEYDDYTMKFMKIKYPRFSSKTLTMSEYKQETICECEGLFFDQLHETIENKTGLYTKLGI